MPIDPRIEINPRDGALGAGAQQSEGVAVIIATSSAGVVNALNKIEASNLDAARDLLGPGPLRSRVAMYMAGGGQTCFAIRAATSAAGARSAVHKTAGGGSTQTLTISGNPNDAYLFRVDIVTSSNASGDCEFQVSRDNGKTLGPKLKTSFSGATWAYVEAESNITITFNRDGGTAANSYAAGDVFRFNTTPPTADDASLEAAIDAALNSSEAYEGVVIGQAVAGSGFPTTMGKFKNKMEGYAGGLDAIERFRYLWLCAESDPPAINEQHVQTETTAAWVADLENDADGFDSIRVGSVASWSLVEDSFTIDVLPRNLNAMIAGRRVARPVNVLTARTDFALPVKSAWPSDWTDQNAKTLHDKRWTTVKGIAGRTGVFIKDDLLFAPSNSDFQTMERRRVMDKACRVTYQKQVDIHMSDMDITNIEESLKFLASVIESPLAAMQAAGEISGYSVIVAPGQDIVNSQTLKFTVGIVPRGAARVLKQDISFRRP